jgi:hypothetical protein
MYFMATAVHPPEDSFDFAIPPEAARKLSPSLKAIMEKAMSMKPDDRFQTIEEFRDALHMQERVPCSRDKVPWLPAALLAASFMLFLFAESRLPAFYALFLGVLIYGFIWAVREIRKGSREPGRARHLSKKGDELP